MLWALNHCTIQTDAQNPLNTDTQQLSRMITQHHNTPIITKSTTTGAQGSENISHSAFIWINPPSFNSDMDHVNWSLFLRSSIICLASLSSSQTVRKFLKAWFFFSPTFLFFCSSMLLFPLHSTHSSSPFCCIYSLFLAIP